MGRSAVRAFGGLMLAALALSGCAAIPTSGEVEEGGGVAAPDLDAFPIPASVDDTDPVRLVEGFFEASAAGVQGDFTDARRLISGLAALEWDPTASVTVFGTGDFEPEFDQAAGTVTYALPVAATVDAHGRMTEAPTGTRARVTFGVVSDASGRWRITSLDDGIVIAEANFDVVYRPVVLAFGSRDLTMVVPDLRWLPRKNITTRATLELLDGPSPWLADAVMTGFSATGSLSVDAVPVADGLATVALAAGSTGTAAERSLALEQITHTLGDLPDILSVEVTVGGPPIGGDGSVHLRDAPVPSTRAAALINGGLGVWNGDQLLVAASGANVPADARDLALAWDSSTVAMLVGDGTLAMATLGDDLVPFDSAGTVSGDVVMTTTYEGDTLVAPSIDRQGWTWTAEAFGTGTLIGVAPDGRVVKLAIAGAEGRDIGALAVSRDGTRVAVVSREGGLWRLGIVALVRTEDGTPVTAGEQLDLGVGIGPSEAVTWVDDYEVAVLGTSGLGETPSLRLVEVGGRTEVVTAVADAVGVAARSGSGSLTLVTRDGSLFVRSTSGWSRVPMGAAVSSLAFSG